MMMKNYYLVLGVPRDEEDPRGIRDAYRQLAKQYHPDRAGPAGAMAFRDVVEAYEVLAHDEQRALHDQGLRRAEGRLDVAPDSIVLPDDVPLEPLAPASVSIPRGFRHAGPSPEELLDRVLHNLLTARASKAERLQALDAELVLSAAEVERGGPGSGASGNGGLPPATP
jgi:molecular chaperone DnaJ